MEPENYRTALSVMTGLVPVIHVAPFPATQRVSGYWTTWMTGTSPVMTMLPSFFIPPGFALIGAVSRNRWSIPSGGLS
jgi:hypothetical protein